MVGAKYGCIGQIPFLSMVCIHMKTNPYVKIALDLYFPRQKTQENKKNLEAASGDITLRGFPVTSAQIFWYVALPSSHGTHV